MAGVKAKTTIRSGEEKRVRYVDTLDKVSLARYHDKVKCVNGIDPYEHAVWSDDATFLPRVEQGDIFDYLLHRTSYYTSKSFKAQKQLGAHNQMTSGWVKKFFSHRPQGSQNVIITSEVSIEKQTLHNLPLYSALSVSVSRSPHVCHRHTHGVPLPVSLSTLF